MKLNPNQLEKLTKELFPKPFQLPWEKGTLLKIIPGREPMPAFNPEGLTKETRRVLLKEEQIFMYLGLDRYGTSTEVYKYGKSNIIMKLFSDKVYYIKVHPEWTKNQFEELNEEKNE